MSVETYSIANDIQSAKIFVDRLSEEISGASLSPHLDSISVDGDQLHINFSSTLPVGEKPTLDALVINHSGEPFPEEINPLKTKVTQQPPFADKTLPDGRPLFRRKHGVSSSILANETKSIKFEVPYGTAKVDEVEIINCVAMDKIDLIVLDSTSGTYTTVPNYKLNQFGFDVCLSDGYYSDSSNYDAELRGGMQLEIVYKNSESTAKEVGVNITLHEVKELPS